jgi:two-component system, NarL family, sensor histidine kinase DesK
VPEPSEDPRTGLTSFRRYTWWSLIATTGFILIYLVGEWILDSDVPVSARVPGAVGLALTVVASAVLLSRRLAQPATTIDGRPDRAVIAWLGVGGIGAAGLGAAALAVHNYGLWALAPATVVTVAAMFLSVRQRSVLVAVAAVLAAAISGLVAWTADDGLLYAAAFPAGLVLFVAWVSLGMMWSWDIAERLDRARQLAAELAVKDERLRFAADLHDIQGHHLQVIALKSELAARLADADPKQAGVEMREVQRLAADALRDTRAVVHGYRRTSLDDEIANATRVLAAADIDARMTLDPASASRTSDIADSGRHLLGLVMREATTNVLRHSRARNAEVDYRIIGDVARLRVRNDGVAGSGGGPGGTGLRTLADRVRDAGGELTWDHDDDWFEVVAEMPARVEHQEAR